MHGVPIIQAKENTNAISCKPTLHEGILLVAILLLIRNYNGSVISDSSLK